MSLTGPSAWWDVAADGTGGTQLDATVGEWEREFHVRNLGTVQWQRFNSLVRATRAGNVRDASSVPVGCERAFVIQATNGSVTPGTQAALNAAISEWRRLEKLLSPDAGEVYLKITRTDDDDSTTVTNMLLCEAMGLPALPFPKGGEDESVFGAMLRYPLRLWCPFPFFWTLTPETATTTSIGASPGTATLNNTGSVYCGVKFVVGSVSGTVTKITVSNSTTGDEFTVSSSAFVNGDTFDFGYTDKQWQSSMLSGTGVPVFATNAAGDSKASMLLAPGNNSISATRVGGTGSCVLTAYWQPCHGGI